MKSKIRILKLKNSHIHGTDLQMMILEDKKSHS
jgi:hypothetical protein